MSALVCRQPPCDSLHFCLLPFEWWRPEAGRRSGASAAGKFKL
eukprot:gene2297-2690_t